MLSCLFIAALWSPAGERANLLVLLYVMVSCVFVTFPCGVLGQVWYLIISIPDLCLLTYFDCIVPIDISQRYIVSKHCVFKTLKLIISLIPFIIEDMNLGIRLRLWSHCCLFFVLLLLSFVNICVFIYLFFVSCPCFVMRYVTYFLVFAITSLWKREPDNLL